MKINFYLKGDKDANKPLPIRISVYYDGQRLFLASGLSVQPQQWNEKRQRYKASAAGAQEYNLLLEGYRSILMEIFREAKVTQLPLTKERLREQFALRKDGKGSKVDFHYFFEKFIEESRATKSAGTIVTYQTAWNRLQNFATETGYPLQFDTIDLNFHQKFLQWCFEKAGLATNTVGFTIKVLKTVMNEAFERKLHNNLAHRSKYFTKPQSETDSVYLTEQEITTLFELDLSENPKLDRVRDLFLIGCHTGLRVSDLKSLRPEHLADDFIQLRTQKTKEQVVIPIHPRVRHILTKYAPTERKLPPALSDQKYNDYLKELCQLAGLDRPTPVTTFQGPERSSRTVPKWELITSHTARRSFATNAYLAGVPTIAIMKITGHRTEKAFLKYIRVTPEANARQLAGHSFFCSTSYNHAG